MTAFAAAAAIFFTLPLVHAQDKPFGEDDSRRVPSPSSERRAGETRLLGEIGPGQFVINQADFGVGRNAYGSLALEGWAAYGRVAAEQCSRRGFAGGHFNGHQRNGEFTLLCFKDGAEWRDATSAEIAATDWSFTDTNQVGWARANRAAERLCALANRGFAGGHFNGHQVAGRYGLYCYGGSKARWFDATDAQLAATGFGFATPRLDDVPWDQAMRAATGFCVGRGYAGGFMNGHQAPNRYGVVCQNSGAKVAQASDSVDNSSPTRASDRAAASSRERGGFAEPARDRAEELKRALEPPFIADVRVDTGWILAISFTSTEKTQPRVEICECAPIRVAENQWKFPNSGEVTSAAAPLQGDQHFAEFDVLLQSLHAGKSYNYIITVASDDPSTSWPEQSLGRFNMAATGNPGFRCDSQEPQLIRGVDGSTADCYPYFCRGARCETTCNSVDNCIAPTVCDTSGQCILPNYNSSNGDD